MPRNAPSAAATDPALQSNSLFARGKVRVAARPPKLQADEWPSRSSSEGENLSNASTPTKEKMANTLLRWSMTGEDFVVARGVDQRGLAQRQPVPVLEGAYNLLK